MLLPQTGMYDFGQIQVGFSICAVFFCTTGLGGDG
jgi:hypothetical protein